ncbi:MAG: SMODS domain-containing nucleotidyltransferase [Bacillota bacterium]
MTTFQNVNAAFGELLRRIELNPTWVQLASQRYNGVKNQIERALPGKYVKQVGSFQRKTKIRPLDPDDPLDIDAIVCFGSFHHYAPPGQGITPAMALDIVRRALVGNGAYKIMSPLADAPTVVLEYADGFKIELAPCFVDKTGQYEHPGGPDCYIVGTTSDSWYPADYDYDASVITRLNQSFSVQGAFVPSVKLVKAFIRGQNLGLKSFHSEILCALVIPRAIAYWEAKDLYWGYQYVLAHFLSEVVDFMTGPVSLPGSYSLPVDSGFSKSELLERGHYLARLGELAWKICELGDTPEALNLWREFYGEPFPA